MPPSEDQQTDELKKAYDAVCKKVLAEKGISVPSTTAAA